jgi:isochorismate hydrolase
MRKEKYFTRGTVVREGKRMAASLPVNPRAAALSPAAAALLVVDMQEYFLRPESHAFLPAAPAILANILALAERFERAGRPVFLTRHANTPDNSRQMAFWWRDLLTRGHPLGAIAPGLALPGRTVIEKSQYDAFIATDLEDRLRAAGVEQLAVAGVATHLCCESTARSAFARGFAVFMVLDATATWNRRLHVASLRALAHACAVPLRTADLLAALAKKA